MLNDWVAGINFCTSEYFIILISPYSCHCCSSIGMFVYILYLNIVLLYMLLRHNLQVPWHVPCGGVCYGDGNLVFIANDWHTALLPVYLKAYYRDHGLMQYTRSILVIHNIAHQVVSFS